MGMILDTESSLISAEARRESFVLHDEEHSVELEWSKLPSLEHSVRKLVKHARENDLWDKKEEALLRAGPVPAVDPETLVGKHIFYTEQGDAKKFERRAQVLMILSGGQVVLEEGASRRKFVHYLDGISTDGRRPVELL
jgi:hypothetical protein